MTTAPHTWILGLGVTGLSCVRFLADQGESIAVWDSREAPPGADVLAKGFANIELSRGPFDGNRLATAKRLVVSPGIPLSTPAIQMAIEAGVEVIGDVELFARSVDAPVLAITGSNGKSTVTTLVGLMAEAAGRSVGVGGNIGMPALDLLGKGHDVYVLELSSFQLETTSSLKPMAATVLNVSADHMDRYDSFEAYRDAKLSLYQNAELCIENRADPSTFANSVARRVSFGLDKPEKQNYGLDDGWICQGERALISIESLKLVGAHNHVNAMAALALGQAAELPVESMLTALADFAGLPHRCQLVTQKQGIKFVNDSKATNIGATLAALEGLRGAGDIWLIAGGDAKGADLSELSPALGLLAGVFTIGKDGPKIAELCSDAIQVDSLAEAVNQAAENAKPGDIVLLSPACASLDMFSNFEQRGRCFTEAVEALL